MRTVRFIEGKTRWPYVRQTPRNNGIFGGARFLFGCGEEPADWLVVLNGIPDNASVTFPRNRTIFLSGEPPAVRTFNAGYLAQFGLAISVDPDLPHPNKLVLPTFLPWHVGVRVEDGSDYGASLTFAELQNAPPKSKLCSCITSTRSSSTGHHLRLAFIERLRRRLEDRIDFFGRGFRPIPDKNAGLAAYRYHIAIENCAIRGYWTEKLADPLLRNCFPIYFGAPNIYDYFDPSALAVIDINEPDVAVDRIARILESDLDLRSAGAVAEAKRRVMWDHNLLARLDRLTGELEGLELAADTPQQFRPEAEFLEREMPWHLRVHSRFKRRLQRLRGKT